MNDETTTAPPTRSLAEAASALATPAHIVAGVKGLKGWDDLYPVTDEQLLAAVAAFNSIKLG